MILLCVYKLQEAFISIVSELTAKWFLNSIVPARSDHYYLQTATLLLALNRLFCEKSQPMNILALSKQTTFLQMC